MKKYHKLLLMALLAGCGPEQALESTSRAMSDYEDALADPTSSNISSIEKIDLGWSFATNVVGNPNGVAFVHRGHLMRSEVSSGGMEKITGGGANGPGVTGVYAGEGTKVFASIGYGGNAILHSTELSAEPSSALDSYSSLSSMRDTVQIGERVFVINNPGRFVSTAQISMASTTDRIFEPLPANIDLSNISPITVVGLNGYDFSTQVSMLKFGSRLAVFTKASPAEKSNALDSLTIDANGSHVNNYSVHVLNSAGERVRSITGVGFGYVLVAGSNLAMYQTRDGVEDIKIISSDGSLATVDAPLSQHGIYSLEFAVYSNGKIFFTGWDTERRSLYSMPTSGSRVDKIAEIPGASSRERISLASVGSDIFAKFRTYTSLGYDNVVLKIDTGAPEYSDAFSPADNVTDVSRAFHSGVTRTIHSMTAVGDKLVAAVDMGSNDSKVVLFDPSSDQAETVASHRYLYGSTAVTNFRSAGLHLTPVGSDTFYYVARKASGGYALTRVDLVP